MARPGTFHSSMTSLTYQVKSSVNGLLEEEEEEEEEGEASILVSGLCF